MRTISLIRPPVFYVLLAAILLSSSAGLAADNFKNGQDITGSWKISVAIPANTPPCPGAQSCVIFALATAAKEGTVIQTAGSLGISSGHGVWVRTGLRQFSVLSSYFRFGELGELIGTSETVTNFELSKSGLEGTGTYENTLFDLEGNIVGTFSGDASAKRIVQ